MSRADMLFFYLGVADGGDRPARKEPAAPVAGDGAAAALAV